LRDQKFTLEKTNIHNTNNLFNNTPINSNLASYFAGLFEGDGHISLKKNKTTNKINSAVLGITFNIKELILYLQSKLGGKIRLKTKYNACDLQIELH